MGTKNPGRVPLIITLGHSSSGQYPLPFTVLVFNPILDLVMCSFAVEMVIAGGNYLMPVVGVDERLPYTRSAIQALLVTVAEAFMPVFTEIDPIIDQVPVPYPAKRCFQREFESLLAFFQFLFVLFTFPDFFSEQ